MEAFITAAVFSYPHEITIVKHFLEEAGISFYFENEAMAGIVPFYSAALGGIRLRIHPNDTDTVTAILEKIASQPNLRIV